MTIVDSLIFYLTLITALGCGLIAGAFFAFSSFVMRALARIPSHEGISAMQSINIVVINPLFLGVFVGTAIASLGLVIWSVLHWSDVGSAPVIFGCLLYLAGTFIVTIAFNVPLNDILASVDPASQTGAEVWSRYLSSWPIWNHIRTVSALAATASLFVSLVFRAAHH